MSSLPDNTLAGSSAPIQAPLLARLLRLALPAGILGAGLLAYSLLSIEPAKEKPAAAAKQLIRTRVVELRAADHAVNVRTHGIVTPHNQVSLGAQVSGVIRKISPSFEAGAYFSEGVALLELEDQDYRIALAAAEARLLGAKSALQLASINHERNLKIFQEKLIPEAEVDQTAAFRAQAAADVDAAAAQVERAKRDLERTVIRAPFDGRVRAKSAGLGQLVGPGTLLGSVFAIDFAEVRLPIASRELAFLDLPERESDPPLEVELRDSVNASSEIAWRAKIVRTEGALDENSLDLFAVARVDDPFGLRSGRPPLRIGQPVAASITGRILTNVIALPRGAVRQLDQIVLVDRNELTLQSRTIVPVWADERRVFVRDPRVQDGAWLSTTHLVYAPNGAKVEIIPDLPPALASSATNQLTLPNPAAKAAPSNEKKL